MARLNERAIEDLRWKKFPVGSDGFVALVDVMGDDYSVVHAARTSYGNDARGPQEDANVLSPADRVVLRSLLRNMHTTPFEMAEVKLLVRLPMDVWRQWVRHRTAHINEYSTRYRTALDSAAVTLPDQWRLQSPASAQGSAGYLCEDREEYPSGKDLSGQEKALLLSSRRVYQSRIAAGISREQARKDLPLSTYTEAYWKCDLWNVLHFLRLRMALDAQQEIREYATTIGDNIIARLFPETWCAFQDYVLNAETFSRLEMEALRQLYTCDGDLASTLSLMSVRERTAFLAKAEKVFGPVRLEEVTHAVDE